MVNTRSKSKKDTPQPPSKPSPQPKKQTSKPSPKKEIQKGNSKPKSVVFSLQDAYAYFDTLKPDDSTKENYKHLTTDFSNIYIILSFNVIIAIFVRTNWPMYWSWR